MNPNQIQLNNPQIPSPYRNNYHINPAQSKIIYKNPINMINNSPTNNIYPIQSSNTTNIQKQPIPNQQTFNNPHYANQPQIIQNQQSKSHSVSPVGTVPYTNINQNQKVNYQSPPPQNLIYNLQPLSPQYQNSQQQSFNQPINRPISHNIYQSTPNPVQYPQQNIVPSHQIHSQGIIQSVRSNPIQIQNNFNEPSVSNSSAVTFKYQNQLVNNPNPILNNLHHVVQTFQNKPMIISDKPIQQSLVNVHLNSKGPSMEGTYVPVQLRETQSVPLPKIPHIPQPEPQVHHQPSQPIFHMTSSYATAGNHRQQQNQIKSPQLSPVPPVLIQTLPQQPPQIQQTSQNYTQNAQQASGNPIWEQRFIMIYQKFQWFYERYDFISRQFQVLSQQFQNVNSQDQWLQLKQKHDLLLQKIQQIQQQLVNTIHQNQQLAQQYELENRNSKQSDQVERVWEHRYHELLQQYKSLSQNYADLQSQGNNQNTSQSQHSQAKGGMSIEEQAQMQSKFHQLENQYNVLCDEYEKIRIQYERIYQQNTQYSQQNNDLKISHEQARNMAQQLQGSVEELQHENDQLRKQQRKSTPSQQNFIPKQEMQKMQYHFGEEIQKYQEQLQKYRVALDQYEEKTQLSRQQLQKISQIAMERQNKIKELQASQNNNNSKSNHSNNQTPQNQNHDLERRYVNILEQDVRLWRQKQTDFLHKLEMKDMQRRSLDEKIHYLERQLQIKKMDLERLGKNFDQKLLRIQQNTASQLQAQGASRNAIQQQVGRPVGNSQYEAQINQLHGQLVQLQNVFNTKMNMYRELQQSIQTYESQIRKQSSAQSMTEIEFQKRLSEIQIEMNKKLAEKDMRITVLNSQVQRLQDAYEGASKDKSSIKQALRAQFHQNQRQINQKYVTRITELQKKMQQKSHQVSYIKQISLKYEKQLKLKNEQLIELRNFVTQVKKTTVTNSSLPSRNDYQMLKDELKIKEQILERKNQQLSKTKRQKQYKLKHINELEHQLQELNSELNKRRSEVSGLKRQLNDFQSLQSDYETVSSNLNKKMIEINQMKQQLFEIQKLRMQNESQRRDLERYVQDSKDRYKQIEKLKQQNYQLERKLSSSKNFNNNASNVNINPNGMSRYQGTKDDSQNTQLRQLVRKKDSQISRINQLLQQNQYVLENRSRDLQMQKSQLAALTRSKQSQVSSLSHNVSSLELRLKQSDSKRSKLSQQTNELRVKFEEQLKTQSQRQKTYYDKVIMRYEQDYKLLKQKIRGAQQSNNKMQLQLQKSRTVQKNLQIQIRQLTKKISNQQSIVIQKQQLYSTFRQKQSQSQQSNKIIYQKLSALQLQLKTKQQQLKLSQQKNAILQQKIKKNKKDYENFRNKLIVSQQYQNNNSVVQYLSKRIAQYQSKMINQSERDFGFKVKNTQANHVFENQVVYHLKMENQMLRKQLEGKGIQFDRKVLNQLQEENLKRSKNLLRNSAFSSKLGNISSGLMIKDNIDDANFYKQKNKQLQQRVQKHLKVNRELKQKIQSLIKGNSQTKQIQYFKQQINEYQLKISQLEKKVQTLTQQNKNINKGMSKRQSRVQQHYEQRIKQFQSRFIQMNKTIQQLTKQKSDLQINKSQIQMQKVTLNDQIKRLNEKISSLTNTKHQRYQQEAKQLRQKCDSYQSEIAKLTNRARILEEQIKRLNQTSNSSKLSINELNNLKAKVNQLAQFLSKSENQLHEEQLKATTLSNEVASLQLKCRTWQSEAQRLKQMNQLYAKKQRNDLSESTVLKQSSSGLQIQMSNLQTQIITLTSEKSQLQVKISDLIEQLKYYQSLLQSLEFNLEFIRSDVLVEQTLVEEIILGGDNTAECIDGLRTNVQRKMYLLDQLFNKIKKL